MTAPSTILAAARDALATGKTIQIAHLVTLSSAGRLVRAEISAELSALLNGTALDLPSPADPEVAAWQAACVDQLLRGTVAPVGDLGWIAVHDDADARRVHPRFVATPQLHALAAGVAPPPPVALDRLRAAFAAPADQRDAAVAALAPASLSEEACALVAAALAPLGRAADDALVPLFAATTWWVPPPASPTAPPPEPPAEPHPPPSPEPANDWIELVIAGDALRITTARHHDIFACESQRAGAAVDELRIPLPLIFEIYPLPAPVPHMAWLRIAGCFHDQVRGGQNGVMYDVGPIPAAIAGAQAAKLRRALGMPRACDVIMSTAGLVGRDVWQWVEVLGTWRPMLPGVPDFDGLYLRPPLDAPALDIGVRLSVKGLFVGPRTLLAMTMERR